MRSFSKSFLRAFLHSFVVHLPLRISALTRSSINSFTQACTHSCFQTSTSSLWLVLRFVVRTHNMELKCMSGAISMGDPHNVDEGCGKNKPLVGGIAQQSGLIRPRKARIWAIIGSRIRREPPTIGRHPLRTPSPSSPPPVGSAYRPPELALRTRQSLPDILSFHPPGDIEIDSVGRMRAGPTESCHTMAGCGPKQAKHMRPKSARVRLRPQLAEVGRPWPKLGRCEAKLDTQ